MPAIDRNRAWLVVVLLFLFMVKTRREIGASTAMR